MDFNLAEFNYQLFLRSRKYLIMAIGIVLLSLGLIIFIAWPKFNEAITLSKQLKKEKTSLEKLRQKIAALDELELQPIFRQQEQINRVLPSSKAVFELLGNLKAVGAETGVEVSELDLAPGLIATDETAVQQEKKKKLESQFKIDGVEGVLIKVTIMGNKEGINNFIERLNRIAPLANVTKMNLSLKQGKKFDNSLNTEFEANLELLTYYFNKSVTASLESQLPAVGSKEEAILAQIAQFRRANYNKSQVIQGGVEDLFGVTQLPTEEN